MMVNNYHKQEKKRNEAEKFTTKLKLPRELHHKQN